MVLQHLIQKDPATLGKPRAFSLHVILQGEADWNLRFNHCKSQVMTENGSSNLKMLISYFSIASIRGWGSNQLGTIKSIYYKQCAEM